MTATTCDSSVLVAALSPWHPLHARALNAFEHRVDTLVGHVLVETFSVLTRMPAPHKVAPALAQAAVASIDLPVISLAGGAYPSFLAQLGRWGVHGGAIYDALIAATAEASNLCLLSADQRARLTYDAVGVAHELI